MSEENVEKVRRGYAAFSRGDLEGMVADFASDFEYVATGTIAGQAGVFRGAAEWDIWHLWTIREGKAVHCRAFTSREDALQAAGVPVRE